MEATTRKRRGDQVLPPEQRGAAVRHLPPDATRSQVRRAGKVSRAKRRHDVLRLAIGGMEPQEIADELTKLYANEDPPLQAVSKQAVDAIIRRSLEEWKSADLAQIENVRSLQLRRIDEAMRSIWLKVQDGNLKAIDRYRGLEALRAKIAGTEAPRRVHHEGQIDHRLAQDQDEAQREEEAWMASRPVEGSARELQPGEPDRAD